MEPVPQRIGDADRDKAVQSLREHHAAGRLDLAEFDERMQSALAAKVASDLTPLFADLPTDPGASVVGTTLAPLATTSAMQTASPFETWTSDDERDLRTAEKRERWMTMAQGLIWPAVIIYNIVVGFNYWWLFLVVGFVVAPMLGHSSEEVKKLRKRRKKALESGAPVTPGSELDEAT